MAHKLPSVLVESQGLCEIVGKGGLVSKAQNLESFKNNILTIFRNPLLKEKMGKEARRIAKQFESGSGVDKIITIYREILKTHVGRSRRLFLFTG